MTLGTFAVDVAGAERFVRDGAQFGGAVHREWAFGGIGWRQQHWRAEQMRVRIEWHTRSELELELVQMEAVDLDSGCCLRLCELQPESEIVNTVVIEAAAVGGCSAGERSRRVCWIKRDPEMLWGQAVRGGLEEGGAVVPAILSVYFESEAVELGYVRCLY